MTNIIEFTGRGKSANGEEVEVKFTALNIHVEQDVPKLVIDLKPGSQLTITQK